MKRFPTGAFGRQRLEFYPAPRKASLHAFAALVFPWSADEILICDIVGRGWCIPSGRVEAEESSLATARREALEEAGAVLGALQYIGCYRITERREVRWADCFTGRVQSLSDISMPQESRGRKLVSLSELPSVYHMWNELTDRVFQHALEIQRRMDASASEPAG